MKANLALLGAGLLFAGCRTTDVAPLTTAGVQVERDEQEILAQVRADEQQLLRSGFVAAAPELDVYLDGVLAGLFPQPLPGDFRLRARVIADPSLNAFVLPNGAMFVHSGLMATLENEAQLAAILAHELSHAVHRHGLRSHRSRQNHAAFASALFVGGGGSVFTMLTSLGALSSAMGYSRDLEREADVEGFKLLVAAGYAPREAGQVFRHLMAEAQREPRKESFFFGSHPRLAERSANFRELTQALPAERREGGRTGEAEFSARLPRVLHLNAEAALRAGKLELARESAERALRLRENDARARWLLAETFRRRPGAEDRREAVRHYRAALELEPALPEAHRGLGLELMKAGDRPGAAAAFRRYLELAPAAEDRRHILEFLRQCENPS